MDCENEFGYENGIEIIQPIYRLKEIDSKNSRVVVEFSEIVKFTEIPLLSDFMVSIKGLSPEYKFKWDIEFTELSQEFQTFDLIISSLETNVN